MPYVVEAESGRALRFKLSGATITPKTERFRAATPRQRARFLPIFAAVLDEAWGEQMLEGKGRRGRVRKALAISRLAYAQAGLESTGPGLFPQREKSRAFRHRKVVAYVDLWRVTGYFGHGTGRWLSYHHLGESGRGRYWFDDAGRIRWAGIKGQVTGIVRDLMPTSATIASAVIDAEREWALAVGLAGKRRRTVTPPPPPPRPRVVVPPPPRPARPARPTTATAPTPGTPPATAETPLQRHRRLIAEAEARQGGRIPDGPIAERIARDEVAEAKRAALAELLAGRAEAEAAIATATADRQRAARMEDEGLVAAASGDQAEARRLTNAARRLRKDADERARVASRRLAELGRDARPTVVAVLGAANPAGITLRDDGADTGRGYRLDRLPPEAARGVEEGRAFVAAITAAGGGDPLELSIGAIPPDREQRAHYDRHYIQVVPNAADAGRVTVHELGHALDDRLAEGDIRLVERSKQFLAHRTAGKPAARLRDLFPDANYAEDEVVRDPGLSGAFPFEHTNWYAGKLYDDATELVSLGLEALWRDPHRLVTGDPEYATWLIGILGGTLR